MAMNEDLGNQSGPAGRRRLIESLDRMVEAGRVTEQEAAQLRASVEPDEFDTAVRKIRVRHAGPRLAAAVESGNMTAEEADDYLERLARGEHPKGLRAHLRRLVPRAR